MNSNNIVTIISNNAKMIDEVTSKLVLLRDLDKVESTNTIEALDFVKVQFPNVIILHAIFDDPKRLELLRNIKKIEGLSNTSIIMLVEDCTDDYLISAFDCGVTDILTYPFKRAELLLRIMWNIRKNEEKTSIDLKNRFLTNLGILELENGFYAKKYCEEFLENEIEYAIKSNSTSCVMLIEGHKKAKSNISFQKIVKDSIRLNDSACINSKNKFYVFMPKTKLNGAYAVFDRIKTKAMTDFKISASVIETTDKPFSKIQEKLEESLIETSKDNNSLIVATNAIKIDTSEKTAVFEHEKTPVLNNETLKSELQKQLERVKKQNILPPKIKINLKEFEKLQNDVAIEDTKIKKKNEKLEIDERNAIVYRQAFERKCQLVIEPVFKKYKNALQAQNKYIFAEYKIEFERSYFKLIKGANELVIELLYNGYSKIKINTIHMFNGRMNETQTSEIELVELNKKSFCEFFEKLMKIVG